MTIENEHTVLDLASLEEAIFVGTSDPEDGKIAHQEQYEPLVIALVEYAHAKTWFVACKHLLIVHS